MSKGRDTLDRAAGDLAKLIEDLKSKQKQTEGLLGAATKQLPGLKVLNSLVAALGGIDVTDVQGHTTRLADEIVAFKDAWAKDFEQTKLSMSGVYLDMVASRDALKKTIKACDARYRKLGKQGSHAANIRVTLVKNIRERNWPAATELIDSLIALYDEFDEPIAPDGK